MKQLSLTKPEFYSLIILFVFPTTLLIDLYIYGSPFWISLVHSTIISILTAMLTIIYHIKIKR